MNDRRRQKIIELEAVHRGAVAPCCLPRRCGARATQHGAWPFPPIGEDLVRHHAAPGLSCAEYRTAKRVEQTMLCMLDKTRRYCLWRAPELDQSHRWTLGWHHRCLMLCCRIH